MTEQQGATSGSGQDRTETDPTVETFWSALNTGALLVVAGLVSVGVHSLRGDWPAGFDGWGAAAFVVVGVGLVGYSLAITR
ncbi:hypothetical protein ACFQMA_02645 [Halosimplex aquaticum]|uniref:Uncharacterized protein n=1 Tax=Halosimplex aquaticum TaxID=3026162 RepID=A0ABD5XUE4_9EURY|nr:hypothetical protein [Halosimplex aquaticum]